MNILFDLDGTLTDSKLGITRCIEHALNILEVEIPANLDWCLGPPLSDSFLKLLGGESKVERAVELFRERFIEVGIYENRLYDGIESCLHKLKEDNHQLYLATSKPIIYATKILENFSISHFFSGQYGSELDGTRKDKTSLIEYILKTENLTLENTYMIGDREYDLIGAKNNEIFPIGVTYGYGTFEELNSHDPHAILSSPTEIYSYFS